MFTVSATIVCIRDTWPVSVKRATSWACARAMKLVKATAVVTGASGAIGSAIAGMLSNAGANVVLVGRRLPALEATAANIGGGVPISCDVTSEAEVEQLFSKIMDDIGPCDLLVNVAGINAPAPTVDLTAAAFSNVMAVNVLGPFLCSREAFKHMQTPSAAAGDAAAAKSRGGRIINVGSISAMSPRPHSAAYTTSKYALQGLTHSLALDGRAHGIAVGVVHPGNVISEMLSPEEIARRQASEGFITPEDVAASVTHMAALPETANVLEMTVIPTTQPLVGRG